MHDGQSGMHTEIHTEASHHEAALRLWGGIHRSHDAFIRLPIVHLGPQALVPCHLFGSAHPLYRDISVHLTFGASRGRPLAITFHAREFIMLLHARLQPVDIIS